MTGTSYRDLKNMEDQGDNEDHYEERNAATETSGLNNACRTK
jgi:hypothetical protein